MNRSFPGIRGTLAREFCGFSGTFKALQKYFPLREAEKHERRLYSAADVRYARLMLAGLDPTKAKRLTGLPPIINCRMSKGGVGKTTIAANVGSCLALMGHKVLMIDADPQASLTGLFGIDWTSEEIVHIGDLMQAAARGKPVNLTSAIRHVYDGNMLDLICSDLTMANADSWLMGTSNREAVFKRLMDQNRDWFGQYDVIVVDSAPGQTLLTNSIMFASETILAVVWLDGQSLRAMEVLASNINELNSAFADRGLNIGVHIVANGYHPSYQICKDSIEILRRQFGSILDDNIIPHSSGFMRQMSLYDDIDSGPILEREPNSVGSRSIIDLTKSLIRKYGISLNMEGQTTATSANPASAKRTAAA